VAFLSDAHVKRKTWLTDFYSLSRNIIVDVSVYHELARQSRPRRRFGPLLPARGGSPLACEPGLDHKFAAAARRRPGTARSAALTPRTRRPATRPGIDRPGESGAVLVEFTLVAPILLFIFIGIFTFGMALSQYLMLWNGVAQGALFFAISGGTSSTPYSSATTAIENAAPILSANNLTITFTVNGTACTSDAACQTALVGNVGNPAKVTASYPCSLTDYYNFWPGCTFSASVTELVQ
jgi:Flp pilus assembly protein TadG